MGIGDSSDLAPENLRYWGVHLQASNRFRLNLARALRILPHGIGRVFKKLPVRIRPPEDRGRNDSGDSAATALLRQTVAVLYSDQNIRALIPGNFAWIGFPLELMIGFERPNFRTFSFPKETA